ncbi:MAG: hypothetical protein N2485_04585 [bacterium]|nr:hypothetical protein [bacterium]
MYILNIFFSKNYLYSESLTDEEAKIYAYLALYIEDIYKKVKHAFVLLYNDYINSKINIVISNIFWKNLAYYDEDLPNIDSNTYIVPELGLLITLWGADYEKNFGSYKNKYQGIFAIEVNISNYLFHRYNGYTPYKNKKSIYYFLDDKIDYVIDLKKGKVITGRSGVNPLIQTGEIMNLGNDTNDSSLYILCY